MLRKTLTLVLPPPLSGFFAELSTLFHWATQHSHACHLKPDRAIPLERLYSHSYRVCAQLTFSPCNTPWFLLEPPTTHVPLNYVPLLVDVNRGKLYLQPRNSLNVLKRLEEKILTLHSNALGEISHQLCKFCEGHWVSIKGMYILNISGALGKPYYYKHLFLT